MTIRDTPTQTPSDPPTLDANEGQADEPLPRRRGPGRPFPKGISGNRKGRPKRLPPEFFPRATLMSELIRPVKIPGVRGEVPAILAALRATIMSAVKGNSRSQHEVLAMYRTITREDEVLRDVMRVVAQSYGVDPAELRERLQKSGLELPGNFEVVYELAQQMAREKIRRRQLNGDADEA